MSSDRLAKPPGALAKRPLLLVLGVLSFGFAPMVICLLVGPDGTRVGPSRIELAHQ